MGIDREKREEKSRGRRRVGERKERRRGGKGLGKVEEEQIVRGKNEG